MSEHIHVELAERSYAIHLGADLLREVPKFLSEAALGEHVLLVTDDHVDELYGDRLADMLIEAGFGVDMFSVEPGEASKSTDVMADLWEAAYEAGGDRQSVVVAVGGGVVGDIAGFLAATYARGIPFVQVPTTLLAQVDSSVGGKTGVNLPGAKNMIGAFWQPSLVVCDVSLLSSLPEREYRAGLAEVVKYGVILDENFFAQLEEQSEAVAARDETALTSIVRRCCELKAQVVAEDERETTGRRSLLNYGHTFGHAFEALGKYESLLHGEAISIGMDCAARLAAKLGKVDDPFVTRQRDLLCKFGLPIEVPSLDPHDIVAQMRRDKKSIGGGLRVVLPTSMGEAALFDDVSSEDVLAILASTEAATS